MLLYVPPFFIHYSLSVHSCTFCPVCSVSFGEITNDWFVCLVPDGNIILPGNVISLTYFGRSCSLRVETIKGEDGSILHRPAPLPGLGPDTEESCVVNSVLDSTSADLSLQLSLLTVDDNNADGAPSTPGEPGPAASTPRRAANLPLLSSPPTPCTPSYNSQNPPAGSAEDCVSLEPSCNSEQAEKIPTAPSGGALSTDTFYCLSCSTKVSFRDRARQDDSDTEAKRSKVTYSMIGGLSSHLDVIRETIELPLKHPELFSNYGRSNSSRCHSGPGSCYHARRFSCKLRLNLSKMMTTCCLCRDPTSPRSPSVRSPGHRKDYDWTSHSQ